MGSLEGLFCGIILKYIPLQTREKIKLISKRWGFAEVQLKKKEEKMKKGSVQKIHTQLRQLDKTVLFQLVISTKEEVDYLQTIRSLDTIIGIEIKQPIDAKRVIYRMKNLKIIKQVAGSQLGSLEEMKNLEKWFLYDLNVNNNQHYNYYKQSVIGVNKNTKRFIFINKITDLKELVKMKDLFFGCCIILNSKEILYTYTFKYIAMKIVLLWLSTKIITVSCNDLQNPYFKTLYNYYLPQISINNSSFSTIFPTYILYLKLDSLQLGNSIQIISLQHLILYISGKLYKKLNLSQLYNLYYLVLHQKDGSTQFILPSSITHLYLHHINTQIVFLNPPHLKEFYSEDSIPQNFIQNK
ncbi:hypothetical protein EDI_013050 [Entamoeba dispar SAW760]|uniref:Uncharacterized protein n=1 Tax=Entamoeba dispar (strain ATCC PRA-260 / SAW760) TaxID=370354 RepID=B0EAX9_ENTDS|nr:uncharacterized protein EDI_013050 [Entamoeba dispar SAW760]EDR28321.1 hypothetical protein EDI_013050 [Entamoeba dispar SAW760]|eukprot:EDR28321.1 hypothetical protein EDI_013050 [Entamoeba dispar SAW760]